ncbi:ribonuclease R [Adhaeribacter soli]|uniref:Ribonuclease R n=1 Tax=Adhaeribacter soli TaxID=2607655 RepID=A0A5N1J5X9_9BACT|nr:ribonuclease R [Adhaeribacter soli]KAA9339993.1 ribonuclease R [Adhaeribacter soli]
MQRNRKGRNASEEPKEDSRRSKKGGLSEDISKNRVASIFSKNIGKVFSPKQILRRLSVTTQAGRELVYEHLKQLKKEGDIMLLDNGDYIFNPETKIVTGKVDLATPKYAFVISEELGSDVRVFTEKLKFAMDDDLVKVKVTVGRGDKMEGEVLEILERKREDIVGRIEVSDRFAFLVPDYKKLYFDVFIPMDGIKGAQNGDKVLVQVTEWPSHPDKKPIGEVIRVFGQAGEHEAEINSIMAEYGLPFEFPQEVEAEANAIPDEITHEEIGRRRDMRHITTFTIDPVDAKDFDDALSITKLENGNWEIGVHIADVTHFVQPNSRLEKEAYHRATSVYLVDRTIPMLPERLSNGLCSLRPNEDKLTFSAVFEMDDNGGIHQQWFGKTIIHSDRRFAYEEAQERIETGEGDYVEEIHTLNRLAKILKEKRFKNGAISFETVEVKFKLDENNKPTQVFVKERKDAHKLIEEFMLLANRKVAEFVFHMKKKGERLTMVYRTHDAPDPEKLENFSNFAGRFGYRLNIQENNVAESLNSLGEQMEGKPEQSILQNLAIRTMAKAIYTTEPKGHFGLAFPHYSHFTSPIRRYPDMMAHRLIEMYLAKPVTAPKEEFEERCKHSSDMEKRAADAERASIKYKQVEYMQDTIGRQFKGIVSGLTEWGLYVLIEETNTEGMVRLTDLEDDYYELDAKNFRVIGQKNKRMITFGDEVTVEVKAVNLMDRNIDLYLVTETNSRHYGFQQPEEDTYESRSKKKKAEKIGRGKQEDRAKVAPKPRKGKSGYIPEKPAVTHEGPERSGANEETPDSSEAPHVPITKRNIRDFYGF